MRQSAQAPWALPAAHFQVLHTHNSDEGSNQEGREPQEFYYLSEPAQTQSGFFLPSKAIQELDLVKSLVSDAPLPLAQGGNLLVLTSANSKSCNLILQNIRIVQHIHRDHLQIRASSPRSFLESGFGILENHPRPRPYDIKHNRIHNFTHCYDTMIQGHLSLLRACKSDVQLRRARGGERQGSRMQGEGSDKAREV